MHKAQLIQNLPGQTVNQLKACWQELGVRGDPPHFKQALVRGIAWFIQQRTRGRIDVETRRRLKAAIRNAPTSTNRTSKKRSPAKRKRREDIKLRTGTTLVRTWRGRAHEVTVLDDGRRFRYRDAEFTSLSEIAREITGARWSGPRFFGLTKLRGAT